MKTEKSENRGFSLVELIVVVLILGILSVSVAPQVMKWLGKSKISADQANAEELKYAAQTALADWQSQGGKISETTDFTLEVMKDGTISCTDWTDGSATKSLEDVITETMAGVYPKVQYEVLSGNVGFLITIEKESGKITVECKAQSVTL